MTRSEFVDSPAGFLIPSPILGLDAMMVLAGGHSKGAKEKGEIHLILIPSGKDPAP